MPDPRTPPEETADALRESERRFRDLVEHAPIAIWEEDFTAVAAWMDDLRRRGIGMRLMHEAVAFCQRLGYLKVVLDVRFERGPAIALFEKFGFKLARTRDMAGRRMLDFYLDLYREPNV